MKCKDCRFCSSLKVLERDELGIKNNISKYEKSLVCTFNKYNYTETLPYNQCELYKARR